MLSPKSPSAVPRRRRVVLYNPKSNFFTMPLALLAIGSHLDPARYEVVIVDGRLERDAAGVLKQALEGAFCLGVTVLTGAPIRDAIAASRVAKQVRADLPVIWGGWHPSLFGVECLEEGSVDITVQGQGEETLVEILERLENGQSLEGCKGIVHRQKDGQVVKEAARPLAQVEAMRSPDYSLIPVERYFDLKKHRQLDFISSQGCNFRCTFCADPFVYGRKWVGLSADRIGEQIAQLWDRYRFEDVNFQDETFFTRWERVEGMARHFINAKLPITWAGTMRADQGTRLSESSMALCKQSGLRRALIGVESGSDEMLKHIRKDTKMAQVFASAEKILRHGIAGNFPFIVGFPGESDESVRASIEAAKRLRKMSPDFQTTFLYFKPYPGTEITMKECQDYPLPTTLEAWANFDLQGTRGGPWVSEEKLWMIERFKYYQRVAWDRMPLWRRPQQRVARWRCERDRYALAVDMHVENRVRELLK